MLTNQLAVDTSLTVVVQSAWNELREELSALDELSVALSAIPRGPGALAVLLDAPVMPVCIHDTEVLLGPLYTPLESVCPECLDHWLHINFYDHDRGPRHPHPELIRLLPEAIIEWSSAVGLHRRHARSIRMVDRRTTLHPVVPRRDCTRCATLAEVDLPLRAHCSPWTGIVNRVELTTATSAGAFRATATWAAPLPIARARHHLKRQFSYGRGRTMVEAESGCIAEALERYSLIYRGNERVVRARVAEIDAIHPNDMQLFSANQYRERSGFNASADEDFQVPEPFQPALPVDWIEATPLGRDRRVRFAAAAACLMWYEFRPGEAEFARADTIGCASGRTLEHALTHALLEWVERDGMAIWWENRLRRPAVRLESFESSDLDIVVAGLRAIDRELFLLDCTTDIGIPTYVAIAPRFDGSEPLVAGAADLSARTAAYRAASEVGQVWHDARHSGGLLPSLRAWLLEETTTTQPYLAPARLMDAPQEAEPTGPAWMHIVDRFEAVGLQGYAVDHSRSDVALCTVRALVPGLRHIWNRRAPGRLYDVPVKMGWLTQPIAEADLNPIRCML